MTTAPRDEQLEGADPVDAPADTDRPAGDQRSTEHPTGAKQAADNVDNEPAG